VLTILEVYFQASSAAAAVAAIVEAATLYWMAVREHLAVGAVLYIDWNHVTSIQSKVSIVRIT